MSQQTKPISINAYKRHCIRKLWERHKQNRAALDASIENLENNIRLTTRAATDNFADCQDPTLVSQPNGEVVCLCLRLSLIHI